MTGDDPRLARRRDAARRRRRRRRTGTAAAAAVVLVGAVAAIGAVSAGRWGGGHAEHRAGTTAARTAQAPPATTATTPAPAGTGATTAPAAPPVRLALPARPVRASVRVPVLMYHRVAPAETATNAVSRDLTVTPRAFRQEMGWLAAHGYHPVSQAALFRAMFEGAPLPRRPLVITFDDGYVDAVDAVLPVMGPRRWPATFFIITSRIGERAFLTWPQLRRLDAAGMDIGSHTADHVELPGLDAAGRAAQLRTSRRTLERGLGHPVPWFCYPAGRHDEASVRSVEDAGYLLAYTTEPGSTLSTARRAELPRVRVAGGESLDAFAAAVEAASGA
jgi:peptidoglycan/xylan/chitin deacetylase (PgdA/CDA1 family)